MRLEADPSDFEPPPRPFLKDAGVHALRINPDPSALSGLITVGNVRPNGIFNVLRAAQMGKYLIVLVHGTFAHNTEWIHEGSVLWRSLVRELSSDVQIISFPWSGKNIQSSTKSLTVAMRFAC